MAFASAASVLSPHRYHSSASYHFASRSGKTNAADALARQLVCGTLRAPTGAAIYRIRWRARYGYNGKRRRSLTGVPDCALSCTHKELCVHAVLRSMEIGIQIPNPIRKQEGRVSIYNTRRFYHTYVLGKSGYGKSTALERWAIDDILNNECTIFFDVHGESVDTILQHIPPDRWDHTILLDFADRDFPFPFNPLHGIPKDKRPYVASSLLDAVKGMWDFHAPTPNIDLFTYAINASLPGASLSG